MCSDLDHWLCNLYFQVCVCVCVCVRVCVCVSVCQRELDALFDLHCTIPTAQYGVYANVFCVVYVIIPASTCSF